jgi:predicted MFS family arabinose efflux permease
LLPRASRLVGAGRLTCIALTCFVPALLALAFSRGFVAAFVAWLVWHATYTLAVINGITVRQQLTPDELQGRVNTTAGMIALGGTPVGAVLGGLLAELVGSQMTYVLATVPVAVAAGYVWLSPVSRLRLAEG